jgi:thiol reductant ABC exporter CydD subunit
VRNVARLLPPGAGSLARGLAPSVVCGSLAGAAVAAQAALLAQALDAAFLGRRPLAALAPLLLSLAAVAALRAGLGFLQERLAQRLSGAVRVAVRDRLSRRLLALGPRFATGERTGELASSLVGGVEALDAYLAQYLPQALLAGTVPALVLAAVWHADALSGLVLLLTGPLVPLFMWLIGSAARERTQRQWAALSRLAARFHDALAGLATLKAFGREADELAALERGNERHRALTLEVLRLAFLSALVLEALATLGTALVAVEVGLRLLYDRIAFRDALFVLLLAPEFYRPLRALGAAFHAGMAGREAAARLIAIAEAGGPLAAPAVLEDGAPCDRPLREQEEAEPEPEAATALPSARTSPARRSEQLRGVAVPPRIRFEAVGFAYGPGSRRALDGFTLAIAAGETVALVGASGGGKTTAAHLLLRFAEPDAGRILVDDAPLAARTPEAWRASVAWVPQQPRLFHGTLRANLVLGRPDATESEIRRALELSRLEELVGELPAGLETPVGEGGERLSGGEAQRVALARAFLRDAPVLVLDEPTAQLDLATEAAVVDAVARLRRGRTVLLVAHRLTTLASVERVAVVADGRVLEQGPPASLASSGAHYPRLVAAWSGAS